MSIRAIRFLSLFLIFIAVIAVESLDADEHRPNILFFLVDDMGIADTSVPFLVDAQGNEMVVPLNARYRTPNMRRMAAMGMRFSNARAFTVCTPTRASLLTGQHAARLHITTWTDPQQTRDTGKVGQGHLVGPEWEMAGVNPTLPTLPRILATHGYQTIHCGKAHFGPNDTPAGDPLNLGFQINIAGHGGGGPGSYLGTNNFSAAFRNAGNRWDVPGLEPYHGQAIFLTETLTRELSAAIGVAVENNHPFFAYMAHYAVHAPFEVDDRFSKNYPELTGKDLAFATMVEGMDQSLGDLLDRLNQLGVAEETLVIFYSDNGSDGPLNLPLRGKKGTRFEGGTRVPLMVAWAKSNPEHPLQKEFPVAAGSIGDDLITPVDFLPTLVHLAGAEIPTNTKLDGIDFTPSMNGVSRMNRPAEFAVHFPHGQHNNNLFSNYVEDDWKLIYQYENEDWQLVNLNADLGEADNLVSEYPERALSMAKRMLGRFAEMDVQYPLDRKTRRPVQPNLEPLQHALAAKRANSTDEIPAP